MIEIMPSLKQDENDLQFDFIRASGPGEQTVNVISPAGQLPESD